MIRKNIVHKIITLAVIAALSLSTTNAFAEEVKNNTAVEQFDAVSDDVHMGDVVDSGNGQSIVIEVDKDGSFKTMDISQNTYALLKCNHPGWTQITNTEYKGTRPCKKHNSICYYKVYSAVYKCTNQKCSVRRVIKTNVSVYHVYKNKRCTVCGWKKK